MFDTNRRIKIHSRTLFIKRDIIWISWICIRDGLERICCWKSHVFHDFYFVIKRATKEHVQRYVRVVTNTIIRNATLIIHGYGNYPVLARESFIIIYDWCTAYGNGQNGRQYICRVLSTRSITKNINRKRVVFKAFSTLSECHNRRGGLVRESAGGPELIIIIPGKWYEIGPRGLVFYTRVAAQYVRKTKNDQSN